MSRLITKHDKRFNNQTNQSEAKLNSSFSHDKTGVDKAKSSTSPNSRAAVDWKKLLISSKDINYKTYHCNYCHLCWFIHVRIIIMIINNTEELYSQHCHDHIDENQHDNLNRSSWSATYWWSGSFRERPRASDSKKEFQETIRWLSTMVKIRNYSQKFGEDVPENTAPTPRHALWATFSLLLFPHKKSPESIWTCPPPLATNYLTHLTCSK